MVRTCLVVLPPRDPLALRSRFEPFVESLNEAGFHVDLLIPDEDTSPRNLASRVLRIWDESPAEVLAVLDGDRPYRVNDVLGVIRQVQADPDRVALASRFGGRQSVPLVRPALAVRAIGRLQRILTGSRDPAGGLVAMSRSAFERERPNLAPIGRQLALECLLKCRGRTVDVPVATGAWPPLRRPHLDDVRQSKRLLNLRFGAWSRLAQFCLVGASGMVIDLATFAILSNVVLRQTSLNGRALSVLGRPLELIWVVSAAVSISLALVWNFTLNRRLTFSDRRQGSIPAQFLAYVVSNALAVSLSFLLRLGLPLQFAFFSDHRLVAAVVGIVAATAVSFTLARALVFRNRAEAAPSSGP